jgi:hypothetical protein
MLEEALTKNLEYVDVIQNKAPVERVSQELQKLFDNEPENLRNPFD